VSSPGGLAFVTVFFETEWTLMLLQARSMARFLPEPLCDEIVVIDNSAKPMGSSALDALRDEYGALGPKVRVLQPVQVADLPRMVGWRSQQVMKLLVARQLHAERYVALDAKNHFVATPQREFFEAPDGRPRVNAYSYRDHPLRPDLVRVLTYLDLPPDAFIDRFTATVTPFVLDTATVTALVSDVESRSGRAFAEEFLRQDLTEFFLYSGWLVAQGHDLDKVFDLHQVFCPSVWPRSATSSGVELAARQARERGAPLFAVHRRAFVQLDADAVDRLADFWVEVGLFDTADQVRAFVADFQEGFRRTERAKRLREAPQRAMTLVRRTRRSLNTRRS
jgi:hypothetical protein